MLASNGLLYEAYSYDISMRSKELYVHALAMQTPEAAIVVTHGIAYENISCSLIKSMITTCIQHACHMVSISVRVYKKGLPHIKTLLPTSSRPILVLAITCTSLRI